MPRFPGLPLLPWTDSCVPHPFQLEKLQRSVYSTGEGKSPEVLLVDNIRSPQLLNQRVVFSSFPTGERREWLLLPLLGAGPGARPAPGTCAIGLSTFTQGEESLGPAGFTPQEVRRGAQSKEPWNWIQPSLSIECCTLLSLGPPRDYNKKPGRWNPSYSPSPETAARRPSG